MQPTNTMLSRHTRLLQKTTERQLQSNSAVSLVKDSPNSARDDDFGSLMDLRDKEIGLGYNKSDHNLLVSERQTS